MSGMGQLFVVAGAGWNTRMGQGGRKRLLGRKFATAVSKRRWLCMGAGSNLSPLDAAVSVVIKYSLYLSAPWL